MPGPTAASEMAARQQASMSQAAGQPAQVTQQPHAQAGTAAETPPFSELWKWWGWINQQVSTTLEDEQSTTVWAELKDKTYAEIQGNEELHDKLWALHLQYGPDGFTARMPRRKAGSDQSAKAQQKHRKSKTKALQKHTKSLAQARKNITKTQQRHSKIIAKA